MSVYGNSCFDYRNMIVTEAYFGKTETLLEIEKQIGIIRQNALKKFSDMNRSVEVLKLNRLFEKQFGMDCFALHIEPNNTINAYTVPVALNFDISMKVNLSKSIIADKTNGYRFIEGNNLCIICNIYYGLISNPDFSDAEILAVILHELGHNFADAIYKEIQVDNQAASIGYYKYLIYFTIFTLGIGSIISIPAMLRYNNKRKNKQNKKTRKRRISSLFKGLKANYDDFKMYVNEILARLQGSINKPIVDNWKKQKEEDGTTVKVRKSLSRQNEVIADKFAGIYGYGPEQASALLKMEKQVSKASAFVSQRNKKANDDFDDMYRDIYKFDEHPHVIQRLNEEIKTLETELAKADIDPKLIAMMKDQVEQLKALRDAAIKVVKEMDDKDAARARFYEFVNNNDPDAVDEEIEKAITAAFDDVFED